MKVGGTSKGKGHDITGDLLSKNYGSGFFIFFELTF